MVEFKGLRQVAQGVEDLDRAVAFYRDMLGLSFIARFDPRSPAALHQPFSCRGRAQPDGSSVGRVGNPADQPV
ncbi:MAG: VOC family protein, partial [Acidimicrobiia bacterium]